jgi:hypothetical protein
MASVRVDANASVVLFGSWGRRELTEYSDDDWLVLIDGSAREHTHPTLGDVRAVIGVGPRKPGTRHIFGVLSSCDDLVDNIGLQDDDNRNLTHRMLLMLESTPVAGVDAYARAWTRVLDGYLSESRRDRRLPRFFLNDVVRYWRTIAVDFVGKQRQDDDKWGLRNAKLRTSRKILFAGGLIPILRCHDLPGHEVRPFLLKQLALPATDRIADAFLALDQADAGARCLGAYDRWLGILGDEALRRELSRLTPRTAMESSAYADVRRLANELQAGLLALLFETRLAPTVREYAIF